MALKLALSWIKHAPKMESRPYSSGEPPIFNVIDSLLISEDEKKRLINIVDRPVEVFDTGKTKLRFEYAIERKEEQNSQENYLKKHLGDTQKMLNSKENQADVST